MEKEQKAALMEQFGQKYKDGPLPYLAGMMRCFERDLENLEQRRATIQAEYDFLRFVKIPETMEEQNIQNIAVGGVGKVTLTADMHVSIKAGAAYRLFTWLEDIGSKDAIRQTVNPSTLKALIKSRIKAGKEVPESDLNISPFVRATITNKE